MTRRVVPDVISGQSLSILPPTSMVREAAKLMAERKIGAVIIAEEGRLVGIVTERDIAYRVVALDRDPRSTPIDAVMTSDLATIAPEEAPIEALRLMRRTGCRHLPVLDGERIVGMLSIRDLYASIQADLEQNLGNRSGG